MEQGFSWIFRRTILVGHLHFKFIIRLVCQGQKKLRSPGAWGVVWDLVGWIIPSPVYAISWQVFEFWCSQGVDGFRCDQAIGAC